MVIVDDVLGWDFVNNDNDPSDDHGHGTNVAGIVGANANNSIGYSGVDWNCKIMTCKIIDENSTGFYSNWANAIYYAVDNGAHVINMSVGGSAYSRFLEDAVDYAIENTYIKSSVKVYPNPSVRELNVSVNKGAVTFYLYNQFGKLVLQGYNTKDFKIDTTTLPNRFYVLKVKAKDRSRELYKILIN